MSQPPRIPRYMYHRPLPITISDSRTAAFGTSAPRPPAIERIATSIELPCPTPPERESPRDAQHYEAQREEPSQLPPPRLNTVMDPRAQAPQRRTLPPAARAVLYEIVANLWVGLTA